MYSKITNPETGRKVNINSRLGKCILKNYLKSYQKAGTFSDDSSLFFMSLTGIDFDHGFGIIITSDIEFKGMFASNFYLHTPYLWCDWDSTLKLRAIDVVYKEVNHIESFKYIEVFESFSNLWTAILKENINNEIITVPPILYELLFFPLFDDYSILDRIDDSKHKIDVNHDIHMRIESIQWLPATDYILNHNSLLPDNLKIKDEIYDFQSLYKNWLKSRSKNLKEIYYKNDGIKILLTLVFIANIFPQWFNALRRMLKYFHRQPQRIRRIISDEKEIQRIIEDDVATIVRESSAPYAPVATGEGTTGSKLGNLRGDDIEPILVELLQQKDGILHKLISEPIPNHVLRMLQDRCSGRSCDFYRDDIPMNTRCFTTISIGRILVSLHRANVRDEGISLEKKENIKTEISRWSEKWRNLMYFEIQGETYSNTDLNPEPWQGMGQIPRGLSSRLSVNNCSCINEKISNDGTEVCINNNGKTIPTDVCSNATNQEDCEDPSSITRNAKDLLKNARDNLYNILRISNKNISILGKKYNLDKEFVDSYEMQISGKHQKGCVSCLFVGQQKINYISTESFIDNVLNKMNREQFYSSLGLPKHRTIIPVRWKYLSELNNDDLIKEALNHGVLADEIISFKNDIKEIESRSNTLDIDKRREKFIFTIVITVDQYSVDTARLMLTKAIDIRKNLEEAYLKIEKESHPVWMQKELLRFEAEKYGIKNNLLVDSKTRDVSYNVEKYIDIIVTAAEENINSNNFCVWSEPTPIYREYHGPPAPPYVSYEDTIPSDAFSLD